MLNDSLCSKVRALDFFTCIEPESLILKSFLDLADCNQSQDAQPGFKSMSMLQQPAKNVLAQQVDGKEEGDTLWIL